MLKRIFNWASDHYYSRKNPVEFVKSLGVQLGENVRFYGVTRGMFNTEPWLISIGNDCFIANGVQFMTHDGGIAILRKKQPDIEWVEPIEIGNDVMIGLRAIILPGVKIGNRCIIGAGAVVAKNIPDNSVAVGVPAKIIRTVDEYELVMQKKSLKCGHLPPNEKEKVLKEIYKDQGWKNPFAVD